MAAMSLWSLRLLPGKPFTLRSEDTVLLTNAALTDQLQEAEGRTSIRITTVSRKNDREDSFVLCSLAPGKIEQCSLRITLPAESTLVFETIGPNTVYLSGNYIDEFSDVRGIRDVLKQAIIDGAAAARSVDKQESKLIAEAASDSPTSDGSHLSVDSVATRKRRRTSSDNSKDVSQQGAKGKEVELPVPKVALPGIHFVDSGPPGLGDRTVALGDEVALRFKLRNSNMHVVRDNIKSGPLRFRVGDLSSGVPQSKFRSLHPMTNSSLTEASGFHAGVVGMKVRGQRIILVPVEVAREDESLPQYISPPQPFRLECFLEGFTPQESK